MTLRFSKSDTILLPLPALAIMLLLSVVIISSNAFTVTTATTRLHLVHNANRNRLQPLSLAADSSAPDVSSMRASELRKELQSYGISTKSFFEKNELVEAVEKARSEGKTPIVNGDDKEGSKSTASSSSKSSATRAEKLAVEMEKCTKMKVGELKKELESYGISTKSFFEKTEFVRAVAEARVDGVKGKGASGKGRSREEEYDPSYRDVQMQKMDVRALGMSPVIDVRLG